MEDPAEGEEGRFVDIVGCGMARGSLAVEMAKGGIWRDALIDALKKNVAPLAVQDRFGDEVSKLSLGRKLSARSRSLRYVCAPRTGFRETTDRNIDAGR